MPLNFSLIQKCLNESDRWNGLTFNRCDYYDIWALSWGFFQLSCWNFKDGSLIQKRKITEILNVGSTSNDQDHWYFEVDSAFNGLAIYHLEKFRKSRYSCKLEEPDELTRKNNEMVMGTVYQYLVGVDCEHRHFHRSSGFKISICSGKIDG
jgi:hypothetical protein